MKCAICQQYTTWNKSFGYRDFIVCPKCEEIIRKECKGDAIKTLDIIFLMGKVAEKRKKG